MDIYPEDLGERIGEPIIRQRAPQTAGEPSPSTHRLAVVCIGSLGGTILTGSLQWPVSGLFFVATIFTAILYASGALKSRLEQETGTGRVTDYEIAQLWKTRSAQDSLVRAYLKLVQAILAVSTTPDTSAEQEVRGAVRALATAIDSLPPAQAVSITAARAYLAERLDQTDDGQPETVTDDPAALQAEAGCLAEKAQAEADPVIRASLHRRAESLTRRAETASRTLMLLRRNQALREEIAEQISALRTNVTALSVGGKQATQDFADLAASIQRVTVEANAITEARAEIDTLLAEPVRLSVADETQRQRVGS